MTWSAVSINLHQGQHEVQFALLVVCAIYMSCHRDGGMSQGDTRHSMPPARRRGGFNISD